MNIAAWIVLIIIGLLVVVYVLVGVLIWFGSREWPELSMYKTRKAQQIWALTWPFHLRWHEIRKTFSASYRKEQRR